MWAGLHGRLYQKGPPTAQDSTAKQSPVAAAAQLSTAARQAQVLVMILLEHMPEHVLSYMCRGSVCSSAAMVVTEAPL